jgi:23S rRNA (cytidine2498-2'-O)-methyltransferase
MANGTGRRDSGQGDRGGQRNRPRAGGPGKPTSGGFGKRDGGHREGPKAGGFGKRPAAGGFAKREGGGGFAKREGGGGFAKREGGGGFAKREGGGGFAKREGGGGFAKREGGGGFAKREGGGGFAKREGSGGFAKREGGGGFAKREGGGGFAKREGGGGFAKREGGGGFAKREGGPRERPASGGFGKREGGERSSSGGFGKPSGGPRAKAGGFGKPSDGPRARAGGSGRNAPGPRDRSGGFSKKPGGPGERKFGAAGRVEGRQRSAERRPPMREVVKTPRPERRVFPAVVAGPPGPILTGEWLFTTRPGAEQDLIDELYFSDPKSAPRPAGESMVAATQRPRLHGNLVELAFARQGFPVSEVLSSPSPESLARAIHDALQRAASSRPTPWAFDMWVPDSDVTNPLSQQATELEAAALAVTNVSYPSWAPRRLADAPAVLTENGLYAQACLLPDGRCAVGVMWAREALSLAPGGRLRVHVPPHAPSRAAMKIVEALTWLDRSPEPNDLCVDLGAAPGGWTWALLERRARVIAVDPADLDETLLDKKGLTHARGDAFRFEPEEPVDWLFCDMAFRPLEVAALLAKWARRQWARMLVANIKLPMKKKAEHVARVREILEDGGWTSVRVRQLYHDRDEVTVAGVRLK